MQLRITRTTYTDKSTIGMLDVMGVFQCYTLELPKRNEKPCCIPAGRYQGKVCWSHHFQRVVPHILNVPGFSNIEIHHGNTPEDTLACVLVGQTRETDFIGNSERALELLLRQLPADFEIEIVDTDAPEAT